MQEQQRDHIQTQSIDNFSYKKMYEEERKKSGSEKREKLSIIANSIKECVCSDNGVNASV